VERQRPGERCREREDRAERRIYEIADRAGNTLVLTEVVMRGQGQLRARIESLRYGSLPAVPAPENQSRFEWAHDRRRGGLRHLSQSLRVGKGRRTTQEARATYDPRTASTRIEWSGGRRRGTPQAGIVLLSLETGAFGLRIAPRGASTP
jgi:hypothetical protein